MKQVLLLILFVQTIVQAGELYRDDLKQVVVDKRNQLMWQDDAAAESTDKPFENAKAYCQALKLAGFDDWFLPRLDQLKTIVRAQNYPRAIDKSFKHVYADYYWTSTEHSSDYAWIVLFIYEDSSYYHKSDPSHVRCVRNMK